MGGKPRLKPCYSMPKRWDYSNPWGLGPCGHGRNNIHYNDWRIGGTYCVDCQITKMLETGKARLRND